MCDRLLDDVLHRISYDPEFLGTLIWKISREKARRSSPDGSVSLNSQTEAFGRIIAGDYARNDKKLLEKVIKNTQEGVDGGN